MQFACSHLFELLQLGPVELEPVADSLPVGADILGENQQISLAQHSRRIPQRSAHMHNNNTLFLFMS